MQCEPILIVEDEPGVRETMKELLELEGFKVRTADNGANALEVLRVHQRPCLILLDLMMPVMDGWQFLATLQREHRQWLADIPIVVVSAAADLTQLQQQYACHVVSKPTNIATLLSLAHQYCKPH